MKKFWLLLSLFLCVTLCSNAQITNANGVVLMTSSRPLGAHLNAIIWSDFQLTSQMPNDAVVQIIYPVLVASGHYDSTFINACWGPDVRYGGLGGGLDGCTGGLGVPALASFSSTVFYDVPSIPLTLADLPLEKIGDGLTQSLFLSGLTASITTTAVGFAIYYTSATPVIDPLIAAPVTVPAGQGVAWAVPVDLIQTGNSGTGTTEAYPAQSIAPVKGLSGGINYPNANGFNGYLHMRLPNGTIKNTCTTPWLNVPKFDATFKIINGAVQFGNAKIISNDCLLPRVVYNVEVDDASKNMTYLDNWNFPRSMDMKYDIGNLQAENFGGPITVAIPKGIIQNPSQDQVIVQPDGTSLNLIGTILINGVTFATRGGGVTYVGLVQTNPTLSQIVTQPGGTFLNLVGDIRINGTSIGTGTDFLTSFNGRTGPSITPTTGDYTCAQVTGCVTTSTANYQVIRSNAVDQPVEHKLNFSSNFTITDTASTSTNVQLANTAVTPGTYAFPSSVSVDSFGRITNIVAAGTLPIDVTQNFVVGSRTFGTTYHNTSGSAILVTGFGTTSGGSVGAMGCDVGASSPSATVWQQENTATVNGAHVGFVCPVPNGYFYRISVNGAISGTPAQWVESVF